ncbi:MAG TPA: isochorismatase family cysteine hydrolase, partial [Oceanipulchritudo sp.]|nr:isochorismatase family cysteine hydrolase [Oceanipulchritudo sp.]
AIFRKAGCPVFWVQQAFEADLSDAFPHMRRTGKRYTIRDTPGARVLHELDQRSSDPVVIKKRFSAFYGTDLREQLEARGIRTVCLAGITTSWCVRSTATDAYQADFRVVLCDRCMGGFRDADHRRDLAAMSGYIAEVRGPDCLAKVLR